MASNPPRVKRITIHGLFRQYDHRIELRLDDRVTVLHGRNGVGKTVTLGLVAALLSARPEELPVVPFDHLRVDFTDGSYLSVSDEAASSRGKKARSSHDPQGGEPIRQLVFECASKGGKASRRTLWQPVFDALLSGLPVHFIKAQRLFRITTSSPQDDKVPPTITTAMADIAEDMAARIRAADSSYRATSTRLDDSLPSRLFAPRTNGSPISKKDLQRRSDALEAERRRLHEIGLVDDISPFDPSSLNDTQRTMFAVYLKDNEEKLAVFKPLADRADLLLGILNRKFAPKSIKLDKDKGYLVRSHDGLPLDLGALSSGEQHELVLLHTLLFRVEPGAFLLIDEPELSLHVTWQTEFLGELIQIARTVGFDALVATHSPYIVGERRDLMVRLGEPA